MARDIDYLETLRRAMMGESPDMDAVKPVQDIERPIEVINEQSPERQMAGQVNEERLEDVNEEAMQPAVEPEVQAPQQGLDLNSEYLDLISKYKTQLDAPKEEAGINLADALAGAHNILNYSQGGDFKNIAMDNAAKQAKAQQATKANKLNTMSKLGDLMKGYKTASKKSGRADRWQAIPLVNKDGVTTMHRVNLDTGDKEEIGERGYSTRLKKDPITGEYFNQRDFAQGNLKPLTEKEKGVGAFGDLNPTQRKEMKDLREDFDKETADVRDSYDKIKGLTTKQINLAIKNPISASQLGAQVATIFENGRLTDEDVLRYTKRNGISDRVVDTLANLRDGTITKSKASEIKESLDVFNDILAAQISERALEKAQVMEQAYGIPANDLVKNVYSNYKEPTDVGPHGDIVKRKGKTYKWNPTVGKYQIYKGN